MFNHYRVAAAALAGYFIGGTVANLGEMQPPYYVDTGTVLAGLALIGLFFFLGYKSKR